MMEKNIPKVCPRCKADMNGYVCPSCKLAICKYCGQPMFGDGFGYRCTNCDAKFVTNAFPGRNARRFA